VFEAASLKDVFARLAQQYQKQNPGVSVVPSAEGSQELRAQIEQGAPADVFASADRKQMDALANQGLVATQVVFACNQPVIIVRTGLAGSLKSLADLPRAERIVLGVPEVPIGAYAVRIFQNAAARLGGDFPQRVEAKVVSRELNVRQVLAKVALGEADAGVVYRSDALSTKDKVQVVEIPPEINVTAEYPIAILKAAPHPDLGRRWIDLVRSEVGVTALRQAGFIPCPSK